MDITAKGYMHKNNSNFFKIGDIKEIKIENIDYCCEEMKEAYNNGFIHFGDPNSCPNMNNHINISRFPYFDVSLLSNADIMPIKYCPFCGEVIKIDRIFEPIEIEAMVDKNGCIEVLDLFGKGYHFRMNLLSSLKFIEIKCGEIEGDKIEWLKKNLTSYIVNNNHISFNWDNFNKEIENENL